MKKLADICYSQNPHDRSYLDIYLPDGDIRAVLVYFHGGGLEHGSKGFGATQAMIDKGVAVVCPNYRLYPNAQYPEFIENAAEACAWVKANPQQFDGCETIFIGGSSAGGYLSLMLYLDRSYLGKYGLSCKDFAGFIPDAGQPTTHYNVLRERGLKTNRVIIDEAAPIYHIDSYDSEPPMLLFVAENDIPNRFEQTILLRSTLKEFGYPDEIVGYQYMPGYKHCGYICTPEYASAILTFIDGITK